MSGTPSADQIALFMVVVARVGGIVVSAPVVGDAQVPARIKAVLILTLSFCMMSVPAIAHQRIPTDLAGFAAVIVVQVAIGLILGFIMRTVYFAAEAAGGIVSMGSGLSVGSVFNPLTQQPDPIFTQFYSVVAALTFLALDGEAWGVAALARSFNLAPAAGMSLNAHLLGAAMTAATGLMTSGFMLALPVTASVFAASIVLAVLARALPQLNMFVLSMPVNLLLSLVALIGGASATVLAMGALTQGLPQSVLAPLALH